MAELYDDWLVSKMTRAELNELSSDEKKERLRLQQKQYRKGNQEKEKERHRKYGQTPVGKKVNTISHWVNNLGLQESPEDLDRIYELRETQELCNACDVKLTRNGDRCSTDASMDHDHETHRFRHIICHKCNSHDNWKKYFC